MADRPSDKKVIDFNQAREERLEEKRRKAERVFFKQTMGIYSVTNNEEMRSIDIVDISEDGLSFQVPFQPNQVWPKDLKEIPLRLYFNQETYLPITVHIQNSRPVIDGGSRFTRYGCKVDKTLTSFEAWQKLVAFLQAYSVHAHKDTGKVTFFYL